MRIRVIKWCKNKFYELLLTSLILGMFPFNNDFEISKCLLAYTISIRALEILVIIYKPLINHLTLMDLMINKLQIIAALSCWVIIAFSNFWHFYRSSDFIWLQSTVSTIINECSTTKLIIIKFKTYKLIFLVFMLVAPITQSYYFTLFYLINIHIFSSHLCIVEQFDFFVNTNVILLEKTSSLNSLEVFERLSFSYNVHSKILKLYGTPILTNLSLLHLHCRIILP